VDGKETGIPATIEAKYCEVRAKISHLISNYFKL